MCSFGLPRAVLLPGCDVCDSARPLTPHTRNQPAHRQPTHDTCNTRKKRRTGEIIEKNASLPRCRHSNRAAVVSVYCVMSRAEIWAPRTCGLSLGHIEHKIIHRSRTHTERGGGTPAAAGRKSYVDDPTRVRQQGIERVGREG